MIVTCDFCGFRSDRHDDTLFGEAPCGKVHICHGCVNTATRLFSRKRERDRKAPCAKPLPVAD